MCWISNILLIKEHLYWPKFLQVIFFLCLFIPWMVNNPVFCAAVMIHRLVALPGFLCISSVFGIVNVMSLVVPAANLRILGSLEGIIIAQCVQ